MEQIKTVCRVVRYNNIKHEGVARTLKNDDVILRNCGSLSADDIIACSLDKKSNLAGDVRKITDKNEQVMALLGCRFFRLGNETILKMFLNVQRLCIENGLHFDNLKFIGNGESALVFEIEGKILKVLPCMVKDVPLMKYLSGSSLILQPEAEKTIQVSYGGEYYFNISIIIEEKIDLNKKVSWNDAIDMSDMLVNDGYAWLDINPKNLGFDSQGVLRLIDYGQLFNQRYDKYFNKHLSDRENVKRSLVDIGKYKKQKEPFRWPWKR